ARVGRESAVVEHLLGPARPRNGREWVRDGSVCRRSGGAVSKPRRGRASAGADAGVGDTSRGTPAPGQDPDRGREPGGRFRLPRLSLRTREEVAAPQEYDEAQGRDPGQDPTHERRESAPGDRGGQPDPARL